MVMCEHVWIRARHAIGLNPPISQAGTQIHAQPCEICAPIIRTTTTGCARARMPCSMLCCDLCAHIALMTSLLQTCAFGKGFSAAEATIRTYLILCWQLGTRLVLEVANRARQVQVAIHPAGKHTQVAGLRTRASSEQHAMPDACTQLALVPNASALLAEWRMDGLHASWEIESAAHTLALSLTLHPHTYSNAVLGLIV